MLGQIKMYNANREVVDHSFFDENENANLNFVARQWQQAAKQKVGNRLYDVFVGIRVIGGISCQIKAELQNGRIFGEVSRSDSNKKQTFEFKPVHERQKINFEKELRRLYFEKSFDVNKKLRM